MDKDFPKGQNSYRIVWNWEASVKALFEMGLEKAMKPYRGRIPTFRLNGVSAQWPEIFSQIHHWPKASPFEAVDKEQVPYGP